MSRVQLALNVNVNDIDEAVAFYTKLLGAEPAKRRPAKRRPGYANFATSEPRSRGITDCPATSLRSRVVIDGILSTCGIRLVGGW
jgi:catechol 2,3-dioxygenase-like lactoylglutathione lyase family enzyme